MAVHVIENLVVYKNKHSNQINTLVVSESSVTRTQTGSDISLSEYTPLDRSY